jgi:Flp pilus assembly pilin Flp
MRKSLQHIARKQQAATALEYAVIAGILVVALIAIFTSLGDGLETMFNNILTQLGVGGA